MLKTFLKAIIFIVFFPVLFRLKNFKNKHLGESVYIVGDSAEIKFYDFKQFDDLPMISFNRNFLLNDVKNRKSILYRILAEPFWFYNHGKNNNQFNEMLYLKRELMESKASYFLHLSNIFSTFNLNAYYFFLKFPKDSYTKKLIDRNVKNFPGTLSASISLAIYMGFKQIYLIGVSHHSESVSNHWYHKGLGSIQEWNSNPFNNYKVHAGLVSDLLNSYVKITGIVPKGNVLSPFETISYEAYTGKKTEYIEYEKNVSAEYRTLLSNLYN